jgi:hypothetical protein
MTMGLRSSGVLLVALGIAVALFGLVAGSFHIRLPGLQREVKKPLPGWFGRLWFLAGGALLIYLGLKH